MPIKLVIKDIGSMLIAGGLDEAERLVRHRRDDHTVKSILNGHEYRISGGLILGAEVIPDAEYEQKQREAQEAAEAEAKRNPNKGAPPKLTIPPGKGRRG
ncbi:MAG: hypothetical protein ACYDH3_00070 [Candidatus Aminicenantales bacterium]